MSEKLKIGLSACFFHADPQRPIFKGKTLLYYEQSMARWIQRMGAIPVLIPEPTADCPLSDLLNDIDGVILQAGADVSPRSYGETAIKPEWSGDFVRDQYEIEIIRACLKNRKPILGICRGLQILNVAMGGTLYQDIPTQLPKALTHRKWEVYDQIFHSVTIEAKSTLSKIYPTGSPLKINTVHHQAIKDLGQGLVVEARSTDDQIIEAIRLDDPDQFVLAVQWHPEFHSPSDPSLLDPDILMELFLSEIDQRKKKGPSL